LLELPNLASGSFVGFFVVPALAGLALVGSVTLSLSAEFAEPSEHDATLITFAVMVSAASYFGISAALWGLLAELLIMAANKLCEYKSNVVVEARGHGLLVPRTYQNDKFS
jgi:predicted benzoate:H+ symporter BenE